MVTGLAFLFTSQLGTPVSVQVEIADSELLVFRSEEAESIPLRHLRRLSDDGTHLQIGRRGHRNWKLTVSGTAADQLRHKIGGRRQGLRWGAARTWHVALFIATLLVVELVKIPAEWLAPILPDALTARLVAQDVRSYYGSYCTSPEGERTLRVLIAKLDPDLARSLRIEVVDGEGFSVTSAPGRRLIISNAFLTTTSADEFAALLAHEIAHLQEHDEVKAALRANGTIGALIGAAVGTRKPDYALQFSDDEEWSADAHAIMMLRRARMSTLPGANLFARMDHERQANRSFGKEQYYLHWGMGSVRAERWRDAQDQGERLAAGPALDQDQADSLFNYCWGHKGPPQHPFPSRSPSAGKHP
jgi:hypothetical protein